MRAIASLAWKDLLMLFRDIPGMFTTFGFPLIYAIFFGTIMGGMSERPTGMDVVVVDEDQTEESRLFVKLLDDSTELDVVVTDRATATERVRKGKDVAYVVVSNGFGERMAKPFRDGLPGLEVGVDPSHKAEAGLLNGLLTKFIFENVFKRFSNRDNLRAMIADSINEVNADANMEATWKAPLQLMLPVLDHFVATIPAMPDVASDGEGGFFGAVVQTAEVRKNQSGPKTAYDISFPQGIVWGLISCAAGFSISLVTERTSGTLVRLRMAPISAGTILGGKSLACFAATLGVSALMLAFAAVVFGVRPDSVAMLLLAIVCSSVCFVGLMMALATLGTTERSAGGIGWGILSMLAMIGGGMIPLMFMPSWMKTIGHLSPVKWTIYAVEGAIWRGFSPAEMVVPCAILVGIGCACFLLGVRTFRWAV